MSEYSKIATKADLSNVNDDECVDGYRSGLKNGETPSSLHSKSFWHGWRNGMVDGGHMNIDGEMMELAREMHSENTAILNLVDSIGSTLH